MFSYPLQVHPCRASIDAVINWRPQRTPKSSRTSTNEGSPSSEHSAPLLGPPKPNNGPIAAPLQPKAEPMSEMRFAIITTTIIVLSYITAMTVSSLEKVLAYVGSTGSTAISFILPGIFYYKISSPHSPHHQRLLKDEDDEEGWNSGDEENMTESGLLLRNLATKTRSFRRGLLRRLSLALAIYGLIVMIVCLGTNTFLIAAH